MNQKTFYRVLQEIKHKPEKANNYLSDSRLTLTEKKVIEAHVYLRKNQNDKALEVLKAISPSDLSFVEGQRKFVIGMALVNLSHFREAEEYLKESLIVMEGSDFSYFVFVGYYNLFIACYNMNSRSKMQNALSKLETLPLQGSVETLRLLRCQFMYASFTNNFDLANEYLDKINSIKHLMVESDLTSHLITEFNFRIRNEDYVRSYAIIEELKNFRSFYLTENFHFMKKLLDHLTKDVPIYAYDRDFELAPLLLHQLKVIQALEVADFPEAETNWERLKTILPEVYKSDFQYMGAVSLFSKCLDKYSKKQNILPIKRPSEDSKIEFLLKILSEAKAPLRKEFIYEQIWGEHIQNKEDLKKLAKLVFALKLRNNLEIVSKKGTYSLVVKSLQKIKIG